MNIDFCLFPYQKILLGFTILLGYWLIGLCIQYAISRISVAKDTKQVIAFIGSMVKYTFIAVCFISSLGTLGIDIRSLITGLGLTGFAVGFAFKDILSNLISGVFLLLYRPFRIGHIIKLEVGKSLFEGKVSKIDLRYTTLTGNNDTFILIPNALLFTSGITIIKSQG